MGGGDLAPPAHVWDARPPESWLSKVSTAPNGTVYNEFVNSGIAGGVDSGVGMRDFNEYQVVGGNRRDRRQTGMAMGDRGGVSQNWNRTPYPEGRKDYQNI